MDEKELKRILVVGSHGHHLATQSVDWGDEFYVGEYDAVIFNLTTLDTNILEGILTKNESYFSSIKKHIIDLQTGTGFPVYCIMEKMLIRNSYKSTLDQTNYGWSPIIPILEEVSGKEIDKTTSKLSEKYLRKITSWIGFLDSFENNTDLPEKETRTGKNRFRYHKETLLKNRAGKDLSFDVRWILREEYDYSSFPKVLMEAKSPITFLPKTENVAEGIDILLELLIKKPDTEKQPVWVEQSKVFGEDDLLKHIADVSIQLEIMQKTIKEDVTKLDNLRRFKKLLYAQGDELHKIVEEVFGILGLNVKRGPVSNKADLLFEEDGQIIPMEVRGKDSSALNEGDVRQVISRQNEKNGSEKYKTRGVFILNHHRLQRPEERLKPFEQNIEKDLAIPWGICLVTTTTLFNIMNEKLEGVDVSGFKEVFLNTVGEYSFSSKKTDENLR